MSTAAEGGHSRLRVYDTLTRQKTDFRPVQPGKVGMYLCGPTVYKPSHVGHMVGPVIFDTVKRYLTYLGYQVTFVVNVTDVDDKLIKQAAAEGTTVAALAERVTADYVKNLKRLGVTSIDQMPKVSETIPDIVAVIRGLIDRGFAYPAGGDVYFDISKDDDYGKLCRRDPEQMEAGARIEVSDRKRNPGDFALWKAAKPGEPSWESPWGMGRPGWHIECTAMAMKTLGATLDIHGGGLDLTFPHHENELAQSESYSGKPFALYWMHNGLMRIQTAPGKAEAGKIKDRGKAGDEATPDEPSKVEKMSKSLGNEIVVSALFERHEPETLRLLLLSTHYRSPIVYSEERLQELRRSLENFYRFFERYKRVTKEDFYRLEAPARVGQFAVPPGHPFLQDVARLRGLFLEAMDDDFNTGAAVGVLFELLTTLNRYADETRLEDSPGPACVASFERAVVVLRELGGILGLFQSPPRSAAGGSDEFVGQLMQLLIDLRNEARKSKNYALGDMIRSRLGQMGVTLEDRTGGTGWRRG
jgi:cysteinyl-tRNA synthetase